MNRQGLRTWIEIDRQAIKNNYDVFRGLVSKDTKLCGVVKSNAYGCDFMQFARELENLGVDWIAVDSITEGVRLRKEGITLPILILGYTLPERMQEAADNNLSMMIATFESLEVVSKIKNAKVHIKLDTGMSRQGFQAGQEKELLEALQKGNIIVEGVFTHFASAKNLAFPHDTNKQINSFKTWKNLFQENGYSPIFHACATSGALLYPEAYFDMVRVGIGLYGLWPSKEAQEFCEGKIELKPTLVWKTLVAEVKQVPAGNKVGYDGTEILERDSKLAICPIGYWHGFSRKLSSIGRVYVGNAKVRVIGRVSMDMIIIDVTDTDVSVGDEVELVGPHVTVYEMASCDDTSWYESITRLNPLIKRIYT